MKLIKTGAAVLNQTPFDWQNNTENILSAIAAAKAQAVTILCLPELCITGYGCEDDFFRTDLRERAWSILREKILPATRGMIVTVGLPVMYKNALFNCAALLANGKILGLVAKQNLAGDGIHYEPRWFESWQYGVMNHLEINGEHIPIGDLYFSLGGVKIGFEICEDAWVGKRPGARLAGLGVDVILNPSASHFSFGKMETRKRLVLEGSRAFCTSYIYSNLLGDEAGRAIYDGGAIIASSGKLLALGPRFSYNKFELTTAVIDVDHTRMAQARTFSYRPDLQDKEDDCIEQAFDFPALLPEPPACAEQAPWETAGHVKEEEFARSVALGLFDYMRKTRSRGYTVSLSGGADSSCVSALVSLMIQFGVQHLGLDEFKRRIGYIRGIAECKDVASLTNVLLTCAYQGSANSSDKTRDSAKELAEALGATFFDLDVSSLVDGYTSMVSKATGRQLNWSTDDIALQNIQARVRSPGIWMLANLQGSVLLCTSNRSEGAVGYCTMDGDTSGGLAPIAGVDKNFIRHWLRWLEKEGPLGLKPIPALQVVNSQTPGPELRPQEAHQAGEQDLMPYDVLDAIEEAAIESNQSVKDCYWLMRSRFPQYKPKQMADWVEKFFLLWSRNQWKRERLAPALHVATRNLDPRTWRRSPILSGSFADEIKEMRQQAAADAERSANEPAASAPNGKNGGHEKSALVLIDIQNGFSSQGELPVPDAESIIPIVNDLMKVFPVVVASQDWHPAEHISFASRHGKKPHDKIRVGNFDQPLFPDHCVQGTESAEFIAGLNTKGIQKVFQKGTKADVDSFSAFNDNAGGTATGIADYLKAQGVKHLFIAGLATNFCVESSALDAAKFGFRVTVVIDACRGIDTPPGSIEESVSRMQSAGIEIADSKTVLKELRHLSR